MSDNAGSVSDNRTFGDRLADLCAKLDREMRLGEQRNTLLWGADGKSHQVTVVSIMVRKQDGTYAVRCAPEGVDSSR